MNNHPIQALLWVLVLVVVVVVLFRLLAII